MDTLPNGKLLQATCPFPENRATNSQGVRAGRDASRALIGPPHLPPQRAGTAR